MAEWLGPYILWLKALHIIAMVAWMAGLFYLPRLFVYHCQVAVGSETSELFKVMERRLLRAIMNPAMIATWLFGLLLLAAQPELLHYGWMHTKLLLVVLLTGLHMALAGWRRAFAEDRNTRPHRFYRFANEVPTLLLIGIVILVIVEPF